MTDAFVEHVNVTVRDADATARWLVDVFGWTVRWHGASKNGGRSVHIGGRDSYVVAYQPPQNAEPRSDGAGRIGYLNHIGVVVADLDAVEARVKAQGFVPVNHASYDPGRRFYFDDADGIEWEVVCYD